MVDIPVKTLSSGFSLPVYGLGTWEMGGGMTSDYTDDVRYVHAIQYAIESGITHIDTAEMYGAGHSEELIAAAMKGFDRAQLLIASKVMVGMEGGYDGVLRACEASLNRLQTDYLDLYMLHRAPGHDTAEIMRALDRLVDEGMVRNIGACNFTAHRFEEIQNMTANKLVCNQVHYSLDCREIVDKGVLHYCQQNDVFITAWGPLGKGALDTATILNEIAKKYGKTPYQVALNWLISQQNIITIPKTSSPEHLKENLGALGWELESEDMQRLADEFPNQQLVSSRVPLDYEADITP